MIAELAAAFARGLAEGAGLVAGATITVVAVYRIMRTIIR